MIDNQDFEIIAEETFEEIEQCIEHLALHVEAFVNGPRCTLEFEDTSRIVMRSDVMERRILLEDATGLIRRFYYDDIEEEWYDESNEEALLDCVASLLSAKVGHPVGLRDAL